MRVCINCSNLHNGGGVQVASSFIDELSNMEFPDLEITVLVSTEVALNIQQLETNILVFYEYKVLNTFGIRSLGVIFSKGTNKFNVVFTVFGPDYSIFTSGIKVTGFAQAWLLNLKNEVYIKLSPIEKFKCRFKFYIQKLFFKASDILIVELSHVKKNVVKKNIKNAAHVKVVHNCFSRIYMDSEKWMPVELGPKIKGISIGFVGRDYPHKNLDVLPEVRKILRVTYGMKINFYVTLDPQEFSKKTDEFKKEIFTVGALTVSQCPSFYTKMDAVIFPSLLECFSATPLETLVMKKPLFASNRSFVKDICFDFAVYFDPINPYSIANSIASYFGNEGERCEDKLLQGKEHAIAFSSPKKRAEDYLKIIRYSLGKTN